jgi:hypothetical protein
MYSRPTRDEDYGMRRFFAVPLLVASVVAISLAPTTMAADAKHACKSGDKQCRAGDKACHTQVSKCIHKCQLAARHLEKKKGDPKLIATIKECISTCKAHNAKKNTGKDCAEKCDACAKACEQANDPALKDCIEECKSCADCCSSEKT